MARPNAAVRQRIQKRLSNADAAIARADKWKGLREFNRKLDGLSSVLVPRLGELMYESIVYGSGLTGAPGQPEEEGDLIDSWTVTYPTEGGVSVTSDSEYARQNEDGVRPGGKPYVQKSPKGGRHSVRLTRRGLQTLVNHATNEIMSENS